MLPLYFSGLLLCVLVFSCVKPKNQFEQINPKENSDSEQKDSSKVENVFFEVDIDNWKEIPGGYGLAKIFSLKGKSETLEQQRKISKFPFSLKIAKIGTGKKKVLLEVYDKDDQMIQKFTREIEITPETKTFDFKSIRVDPDLLAKFGELIQNHVINLDISGKEETLKRMEEVVNNRVLVIKGPTNEFSTSIEYEKSVNFIDVIDWFRAENTTKGCIGCHSNSDPQAKVNIESTPFKSSKPDMAQTMGVIIRRLNGGLPGYMPPDSSMHWDEARINRVLEWEKYQFTFETLPASFRSLIKSKDALSKLSAEVKFYDKDSKEVLTRSFSKLTKNGDSITLPIAVEDSEFPAPQAKEDVNIELYISGEGLKDAINVTVMLVSGEVSTEQSKTLESISSIGFDEVKDFFYDPEYEDGLMPCAVCHNSNEDDPEDGAGLNLASFPFVQKDSEGNFLSQNEIGNKIIDRLFTPDESKRMPRVDNFPSFEISETEKTYLLAWQAAGFPEDRQYSTHISFPFEKITTDKEYKVKISIEKTDGFSLDIEAEDFKFIGQDLQKINVNL